MSKVMFENPVIISHSSISGKKDQWPLNLNHSPIFDSDGFVTYEHKLEHARKLVKDWNATYGPNVSYKIHPESELLEVLNYMQVSIKPDGTREFVAYRDFVKASEAMDDRRSTMQRIEAAQKLCREASDPDKVEFIPNYCIANGDSVQTGRAIVSQISERVLFETYAKTRQANLTYFMDDPNGEYYDDQTQAMWETWKAAKESK